MIKTIIFEESKNKKSLIAEGGEGSIYSYKDKIVKIFKSTVNCQEKLAKIKLLMQKKLPSTVVVPIDVVCDPSNRFIGYMMNRVKGEELSMLSSRKFVKTNNITKKDILKMLMDVRNTLIELHAQNLYIGDLSDLNILFDENFNIYFIDVDSWSIDNYPCTVANESFKDPKLKGSKFNENTDIYAFVILVYKLLTRLHPFGGVLKSNAAMGLTERMEKGITAISNPDVTVPKMVDVDVFIPSKMLASLKDTFTSNTRSFATIDLQDFYDHLTLCPTHADYFYSKYNKCPICEIGAKEIAAIMKVGAIGDIPIRVLFSSGEIKILLGEIIYITANNEVKFRNSQKILKLRRGMFYDVNDDGSVIYEISKDNIHITTSTRTFDVEKQFGTDAIARNNEIYYISNNLTLSKFGIAKNDSSFDEKIEKVSINNAFDAYSSDIYFVCNSYDAKKIISISGHHYEIENTRKIINHAIHYDDLTKTWLFIFEMSNGKFCTYIMERQSGILYFADDIRYIGSIKNIAYHNGFIYKPSDGEIVRFNYKNGECKEFKIPTISSGSKLIKKGKKFIAITENQIYEIG